MFSKLTTIAESLEQLAYDLSLRALSQQEHLLDELRARTGTLLAASAVVVSLLGAEALDNGLGLVTLIALIAFLSAVVSSLYILVPTKGLSFGIRGGMLLGSGAEWRELPRTYARLTRWFDALVARNETLDRLFFFHRFAAVSIVVSVILWSVEIAT